MNKTKKALIVTVSLAALVLIAGTVFAFAQTNDNPDGPDQTGDAILANQQQPPIAGPFDWRKADIDYDALLAEALDITVEELQDARTEAREAAIEQAVDLGHITQQQADLMVAVRILRANINRTELVANALGISVEELREARQDRALRDLLAELDMTPADVRDAVLAEFEEFVEQAVEDDLISEEQAELVLDRPGLVLKDKPKPQDREGFYCQEVRPQVRPRRGPSAGRGGRRAGRDFHCRTAPAVGASSPFPGGI
jgi:hypothetical protein